MKLSNDSYVISYGSNSFMGYDNRGAMATGYPIVVTQLPRVALFTSRETILAATMISFIRLVNSPVAPGFILSCWRTC